MNDDSQFFCYLLQSTDGRRTYIGATVDVDRRLAQHNGRKTGGARATAGRQWKRVLYVGGAPTWSAALQLEWAWKDASRRRVGGKAGAAAAALPNRIEALLDVLTRNAPTRGGVPYCTWGTIFLQFSPEFEGILGKIEARLGPGSLDGSYPQRQYILPPTLYRSTFPTHPTMSSIPAAPITTVSVETVNALIAQVDTMTLAYEDLKKRLDTLVAMSTAAASMDAPKKRGRGKAKAAAGGAGAPAGSDSETASLASTGGKKRGRKPRDPKDKPVCPPAAEGVVRFYSSAGGAEIAYLSPLFRAAFRVDGKEYLSVENYVQAARFFGTDDAFAETIRAQKNPVLTRGMGRSKEHTPRADWESVHLEEFQKAIRARFETHADLREKLLATGSATLEYEAVADSVYGIGADGKGKNLYGIVLMELRAALAAGAPAAPAAAPVVAATATPPAPAAAPAPAAPAKKPRKAKTTTTTDSDA